MTLILVRHTSVAAPPGLCYGRTEVPLAAGFPAEAEAVRAALPREPWDLVSSPAERCWRLAQHLGPAVVHDRRLVELDFGLWEGSPWNALPRTEVDAWCAAFVDQGPPGGESFRALAARASAFAVEAVAQTGITVAVTHAGVVRALLAWHHGLPLADAFDLEVPFGSVHRLELPFPPALAPPEPAPS